jgi:hypothetical protein
MTRSSANCGRGRSGRRFFRVLLCYVPTCNKSIYSISAVAASELDVIAEGKRNPGVVAECVSKNVVCIRLTVRKMRSIMEIKQQQIEVSRV